VADPEGAMADRLAVNAGRVALTRVLLPAWLGPPALPDPALDAA
jgi:hypothetical protein